MALDPNAPLFPAYWDDSFEAQYQAALGGGMPDQQQIALPGELAKTTMPPPPPPPPPQQIAAPGVPVQDEVPQAAVAPPLTPEEEAQIQIDQPQLAADGTTPFGDAGIEMTPPLQADAVSGQPETQGDTPYIAYSEPSPDEYATPEQLGTRMADRSAEEQLAYQQQHDEAQNNFSRARVLEESRKQLDLQTKHTEALLAAQQLAQQKRQEIDAQATEIANTSPLDTISTGRKIAGVAAAIIGGFAMNKTGRNVGLEAVGQMIDEAAAEQATKLQNLAGQRRGINENLATAGDSFQTQEALRLGMWDHFIRNLETEVQNYDPRGTTAIRTMNAINAARAQRQALADKNEKETFERMKAVIDMQSKVAATNKTIAETNKLKGAGAGGGVKQSPEFWAAYSSRDGVPGLRPPMAMTQKEYDTWLATQGKVKALNKGPNDKSEAEIRKAEAEATKAEAEADAAKSGFAVASPETGEPLLNKDGKPFVVMDATQREKLRGITTAAVNIRRLADKIEEVRKKTGGGSTLVGSDDAQELQSLAKAVDFETYKAFDLGAPSAGDASMAEGVRGGVDITSFLKDPTKGLQTYADSVEKKALAHLRGAGYTGNALRFHRAADLGKAKTDVVDELGGKLATALYKAPIKADNPLDANAQQIASGIYKPLNDDATMWLDQLEAYAAVPNDMGDRAKKYLGEIAEKAVYPDMKARAKAILESLPGAHPRTER